LNLGVHELAAPQPALGAQRTAGHPVKQRDRLHPRLGLATCRHDVVQRLDTTPDLRELEVVDLPQSPRKPRGDLGHASARLVRVFVARRVGDPHREHLGVLGA